MSLDPHAFISYAHIDNEPLTPELKGWVTQFDMTLRTMLGQRLGETVRIWRDPKLAGNDVFGDEILQTLTKAALLISVLSPRYVRSEWCTRELKAFCETAEGRGDLRVGNKSRVVKVVKTSVDGLDGLPAAVQSTLGYEFYGLDEGEPIELDPSFGQRARELFLKKVSALALDLAETLKAMRPAPAATAAGLPARRSKVFLADCGRDMRETREQLATDLRMHGYEVLPAQQLPQTEDELLPALDAVLARCDLAIHLVGRSAGATPDGPSDRSLVVIENDVASRRSRDAGLRRVIWLPAGVSGERAEHQAFIDAVLADAALQAGADLIRGDFEVLKGAIHATLGQLEAPVPAEPAPPASKPVVHLLMNEADRVAAVPLIKLLRSHGLDVTLPLFEGAAAEVREANTQRVAACDALVLFYGSGDEVWKFHQHNQMRKLAATGSTARRRSEWLCLAAPATADKALLQALAEPGLLDALEGFTDTALQPLLTRLQPTPPAP